MAVAAVLMIATAFAAVPPLPAPPAPSAPLPSSPPVNPNGPAPSSPEPADYWSGDLDAPTPSTLHGGKIINARQLGALLQTGNVVVIDVSSAPRRPDSLAPGAPWLPLPHPGIPGAIWIPGAGLGVLPDSVDTFFRARLAASTGGDSSRAVVIYCHERCWLSWNAAKRAIRYGYRNVSWFPAGIEGWRSAGFPTEELKAEGPPAASPAARLVPAAPGQPA